ncbi:unnamed protein product [Rotaria magnacalcarata]
MSGVTNISDTSFTDISSKTTERLVYNHPILNTQAKNPMTLQQQEIKDRLNATPHNKSIVDLDEIIEKWTERKCAVNVLP